MENQLLSKFLKKVDSNISEFKSINLSTRYAIIDSFGTQEFQDLSNEFSISVSEIKKKLRQLAKELDSKTVEQHHKKKRSHIGHIKNHREEEDEDGKGRKKHIIEKPTEHDKKKVHRIISRPKPPKHTDKKGHTKTTNPPPPPPKLPPLTIDEVTIIATFKK
jgi:hypothetical protein